MRVQPVAKSLAIAIVSGIAIQNPTFAEEYRGTLAQQLACTPERFQALRRSDTGHQSDRCMLAAKYGATQQ